MLSPDLPNWVLFLSAAKHAHSEATVHERMAAEANDPWLAAFYRGVASRMRDASWDHLAAAREARRRMEA